MPSLSYSIVASEEVNGLALVRIGHAVEDESAPTTTKRHELSQEWVEQAANLLLQQWPRGGPIEKYKEKIIETSFHPSRTSYYALPCSYLLLHQETVAGEGNDHLKIDDCDYERDLSISRCVGHGRLGECFESAGGNAAAATFIVVDSTMRGKRLGSKLMEFLEVEAKRLGYHYVYLWTKTAIGFYAKIGFQHSHRVSLVRPALKHLKANQVESLESLLMKKSQRILDENGISTKTTLKDKSRPQNVLGIHFILAMRLLPVGRASFPRLSPPPRYAAVFRCTPIPSARWARRAR